MEFTNSEVRAGVRKYEREGLILYWAVWALIPVFLGVFILNAVRIREPFLLTASGLSVLTFCCMAWPLLRTGPRRTSPTEPGVDYLRRVFEGKIQGMRWIRQCMLLLIPAVAAAWWGRGAARANPVPFIVLSVFVAFCWFAFWHEGRRFERELQKLG
ncbi:MAG TPA: hypothetical protein VKU01_35485 [Bryobacteraceae bacterium]|nr:hypothetical protein [Bryobacteraceae bacterium]